MSDSQSSGFKGFAWAVAGVWVGAAGPSIAGWMFPSVDEFFAKSGRVASAVWSFLTTTWSVPVVPLLLAVVIATVGALIMLVRIQALTDSLRQKNQHPLSVGQRTNLTDQFDKAELAILAQLLHAHGNSRDADDVTQRAHPIPSLVMQVAGKSLVEKGLLAHHRSNTGYGYDYSLTAAGKELVLQAWRAEND